MSTIGLAGAALPLAHSGHWLTSLVYVAPVLVVAGYLVAVGRRDRRAAERERPE